MNTKTPSPEMPHGMNACRRAANYISAGRIYLYDNPPLKRPLAPTDHSMEGEAAILARSRR